MFIFNFNTIGHGSIISSSCSVCVQPSSCSVFLIVFGRETARGLLRLSVYLGFHGTKFERINMVEIWAVQTHK